MPATTADNLREPPDEPVVHWMERPAPMMSGGAMVGAMAGAFVVGMLVTLAAVAVGRMIADD